MTLIKLNVQEPYFTHIKNGTKTSEGRLAKDNFIQLIEGDQVEFNDQLTKTIISVNKYKTFEQMIIAEGLANVIPGAKNIEEATAVYYKFYSAADELKYGVCAIVMK